ncbi:hypothetical protein BYT27DRAFT_6956236 [Phlegmacium glaucopus]|nr:hypothetical protein BYT27DRAFT_6956236 [Phlegmacium glaucopus]
MPRLVASMCLVAWAGERNTGMGYRARSKIKTVETQDDLRSYNVARAKFCYPASVLPTLWLKVCVSSKFLVGNYKNPSTSRRSTSVQSWYSITPRSECRQYNDRLKIVKKRMERRSYRLGYVPTVGDAWGLEGGPLDETVGYQIDIFVVLGSLYARHLLVGIHFRPNPTRGPCNTCYWDHMESA